MFNTLYQIILVAKSCYLKLYGAHEKQDELIKNKIKNSYWGILFTSVCARHSECIYKYLRYIVLKFVYWNRTLCSETNMRQSWILLISEHSRTECVWDSACQTLSQYRGCCLDNTDAAEGFGPTLHYRRNRTDACHGKVLQKSVPCIE